MVNGYFFTVAVIVMFWFNVTVNGFSVDPFDQFWKMYSLFGVAVILTVVPSSYVPPDVDTDPPVPELTVKVYSDTDGWTGVGSVSFSGEEHDIKKMKIIK